MPGTTYYVFLNFLAFCPPSFFFCGWWLRRLFFTLARTNFFSSLLCFAKSYDSSSIWLMLKNSSPSADEKIKCNYIILKHPVACHLLVNVTDGLSYLQHCLKALNFLKKFSTTCFGTYGHHQLLKLLWCRNCWAHLGLFLVWTQACACFKMACQ
jgi:hypothetical protein